MGKELRGFSFYLRHSPSHCRFVCGILGTQQLGSYVLSTSGVNAVIADRRQNHGNNFFSVYKSRARILVSVFEETMVVSFLNVLLVRYHVQVD